MKRALGIGVVVLLAGALIGGTCYFVLRADETHNGEAGSGQGWQNGGVAPGAGAGSTGRSAGSDDGGGGGSGGGGGNGGGGNGGGGGDGAGGNGGWVENDASAERGRGTDTGATTSEGNARGGSESRGGTSAGWQAITGTVLSVDPDMVLETPEGQLTVEMGPAWYRESQSYSPKTGDRVRLTAKAEGGELLVITIEEASTGQVLALRDEAGRPLWRRRGGAGD